jgi:four helix bundle protein|tara:strand:+ start:443 stop:724 length:282 start_codon:yes stop_codon:yes gene_type:complete
MEWEQLEQHLRGQLIRSATSVAANYRAACVVYSRASFIAKISTVLEEVDESAFWLEFIRDETLLTEHKLDAAVQEARELTSIFFATRRTSLKK